MADRQPSPWRVLIPLLPWTVIAAVLSLVLRPWGYAWLPWTLLAALALVALVSGSIRRS